MKLQARESNGFAPELNELLIHRADRARQKPVGIDEESFLWVAEFPIGEETYAISLDVLRAAVPLKMVTAVPLSPPHVIGILRFQGRSSPRSPSPPCSEAAAGARIRRCCWWSIPGLATWWR